MIKTKLTKEEFYERYLHLPEAERKRKRGLLSDEGILRYFEYCQKLNVQPIMSDEDEPFNFENFCLSELYRNDSGRRMGKKQKEIAKARYEAICKEKGVVPNYERTYLTVDGFAFSALAGR